MKAVAAATGQAMMNAESQRWRKSAPAPMFQYLTAALAKKTTTPVAITLATSPEGNQGRDTHG
jgi:hypothetical protein